MFLGPLVGILHMWVSGGPGHCGTCQGWATPMEEETWEAEADLARTRSTHQVHTEPFAQCPGWGLAQARLSLRNFLSAMLVGSLSEAGRDGKSPSTLPVGGSADVPLSSDPHIALSFSCGSDRACRAVVTPPPWTVCPGGVLLTPGSALRPHHAAAGQIGRAHV